MSKNYYECHITMVGHIGEIGNSVRSHGWKFSAIDGDINLGDGVKCYATKQFNVRWGDQWVINELNGMADLMESFDIKVIRRKVERVIYDNRSSTVRCTGGCVECHLDDLPCAQT